MQNEIDPTELGEFGIHKELISLVSFLISEPAKSSEDVEIILAEIKAAARQAGSTSRGHGNDLLYFELLTKIWLLKTQIFLKKLHDGSMIAKVLVEDQIEDLNEGLENLRKFSKESKEKLGNGKETMVLIAEVVNEELLKCNPNSIGPVKHHIQQIKLDLEFLRSFVLNTLKPDTEPLELEDLGKHVNDVTYKVECVIDSVEVAPHWHHFFWICDLQEEIRFIKIQATRTYKEKTCDTRVLNVAQILSHRIPQAYTPKTDEALVPLKS
ncbi:hypothetical protein ACH5RR_036577 [Cinchona calisaya]|uniref:Uncharacterized protein n=1 Tax=Cinchona calisaya TaxID=153742 RepID=A0ABD2Y928_9GENT